MTSDKKVQKDLRKAAESLREASERLRAPKKRKKSRLGRLILLALVAAGIALVLSEDARKTVLDTLSAPKRSSSTPAPPASTAPDGLPPAAS